MKLAAVIFLAACAHGTAFAQVVTLTLPDVSVARFEPGCVVRLPSANRSSRIEVRLSPFSAAGRVELYLDEMRLVTHSYSQSDSLVLVADAVEPAGLLGDGEQVLQAVRFANTRETLGEWRLRRWNAPFVEASKSTRDGRAPDLRIDEPAGVAFVFLTRPPTVLVKGSVLTPGNVLVKIAGTEVKLSASGRESNFAIELPLPVDLKEIEVYAQDRENGATRQLVLPVITASRPR